MNNEREYSPRRGMLGSVAERTREFLQGEQRNRETQEIQEQMMAHADRQFMDLLGVPPGPLSEREILEAERRGLVMEGSTTSERLLERVRELDRANRYELRQSSRAAIEATTSHARVSEARRQLEQMNADFEMRNAEIRREPGTGPTFMGMPIVHIGGPEESRSLPRAGHVHLYYREDGSVVAVSVSDNPFENPRRVRETILTPSQTAHLHNIPGIQNMMATTLPNDLPDAQPIEVDVSLSAEQQLESLLRSNGVPETIRAVMSNRLHSEALDLISRRNSFSSARFLLLGIILSTEEFIFSMFDDLRAEESLRWVCFTLKEYSQHGLSYAYSVSSQLSGYTHAVKPPISSTHPQVETLREHAGNFLKMYAGIIKLIKVLSDLQTGRRTSGYTSPEASREILKTIFMSSGRSPSSPGAAERESIYISLLSSMVNLNKLSSNARFIRELDRTNLVARGTLFNNSYKGTFMLAPPIMEDDMGVLPGWDRAESVHYDSRHFLYKLQKESLAMLPYMPKTSTYGIHIARQPGGRNSRIDFRTVTAIKPPKRLKLRTREAYANALIIRYSKLIDKHFRERYGLRISVTVNSGGRYPSILDLGDTGNQTAVVGAVRSKLNINSRGSVDPSALSALYAVETMGMPFWIFKHNGALKEEYKGKVLMTIKVEVFSPGKVLELAALATDPAEIVDKYSDEIVSINARRHLSNHPLAVYSSGEPGDFIAGNIISVNTSVGNSGLTHFRSSVLSTSRAPGGLSINYSDAGLINQGYSNYITPYSGVLGQSHGAFRLISTPIHMVTQSLLLSSKDMLTIASTLSRRVIRAGLKK